MEEIEWREYDYTVQLGPKASLAIRPLVGIEISCRTSSERIPVMALVDSGTDGIVLNAEIAKDLGINADLSTKAELGGIGTIRGFASNVTIAVPGFPVSFDAFAVFAENLPFSALVGQKYFFEKFNIRFEKARNKFFLSPTSYQAPMI